MPKLTLIQPGDNRELQVTAGQTIADALRHAGIVQDHPCAGRATCGKCRLQVFGVLSPVCEAERTLLAQPMLDQGYRLSCTARIMGDLRVVLSPQADTLHILTAEDSLPAIEPLYQRYGAAVDIGTTTLCVQLYGANGLLRTAACKNPQTAFGADVISRIAYALEGNGDTLQTVLAAAIERLLFQAMQGADLEPANLDAMVVTGNTTMLYLITRSDPECLSHAPFLADRLFGETLSGAELGLRAFSSVRCYLPPCIGAYLGADITTALLFSGIFQQSGAALLVDAGTNGEIALVQNGRLYCCSTAAGPAFEGGGIAQGVMGIDGAIDAAWLEEGMLRCSTIGNAAPLGICGSGIVDVIAALLQAEALDETGALNHDGQHSVSNQIEHHGNMPAVRLQGDIFISQADIRVVQLAKSAIHAGIQTLLSVARQDQSSLTRALLAGGFGAYMRIESAVRIGLLPAVFLKSGSVLGNAALKGAAMLLQNKQLIQQAEHIASAAQIVDLAGNSQFMEYYVESMLF